MKSHSEALEVVVFSSLQCVVFYFCSLSVDEERRTNEMKHAHLTNITIILLILFYFYYHEII